MSVMGALRHHSILLPATAIRFAYSRKVLRIMIVQFELNPKKTPPLQVGFFYTKLRRVISETHIFHQSLPKEHHGCFLGG